MTDINRKEHWETVYKTKNPDQVSWTQEKPETSLSFISSLGLGKEARIIDIGGGDSRLVDFLLEEGFQNITVLDISSGALEKAKKRLGNKAEKVNWIVSDITDFEPDETYDLWHDRAAFHFLTAEEHISRYVDIAEKSISSFMILGTFSKNGPAKCSGLEITQYDEDSIAARFGNRFEKLQCRTEDHKTPFGTFQNFIFCSFKKKEDRS